MYDATQEPFRAQFAPQLHINTANNFGILASTCAHLHSLHTRYFGGVKLGAGGLVRAYGRAARECLRQGQRKRVDPVAVLIVEVGHIYSWFQQPSPAGKWCLQLLLLSSACSQEPNVSLPACPFVVTAILMDCEMGKFAALR